MTRATPRIIVTAAGDFGRTAAAAILELLATFHTPVVGLSTGNTPVAVYAALLDMARQRPGLLACIARAFAIDEYVCPRDDPAANRAFFAQHWSTIPGAPPVEQFDPDAPDLAVEAERVAALLARAGGLDLALVGIGTNGHLAFNEPGSDPDSTVRVVELAPGTRAAATAFGPEPPRQGLTLGMRELLGARRVLLLANGRGKTAIIERGLRGPVSSACPASFLQLHGALTVVLDTAAASGLDSLAHPGG